MNNQYLHRLQSTKFKFFALSFVNFEVNHSTNNKRIRDNLQSLSSILGLTRHIRTSHYSHEKKNYHLTKQDKVYKK